SGDVRGMEMKKDDRFVVALVAALLVAGCYDSSTPPGGNEAAATPARAEISPRARATLRDLQRDFRITPQSEFLEKTGAELPHRESVAFLPRGSAQEFLRQPGKLHPVFDKKPPLGAAPGPRGTPPGGQPGASAGVPDPSKPADTTLPTSA